MPFLTMFSPCSWPNSACFSRTTRRSLQIARPGHIATEARARRFEHGVGNIIATSWHLHQFYFIITSVLLSEIKEVNMKKSLSLNIVAYLLIVIFVLIASHVTAIAKALPNYEATSEIVIRGVCQTEENESFLNIYISDEYTVYTAESVYGNVFYKLSTDGGIYYFIKTQDSTSPVEISSQLWLETLETDAPRLFDNLGPYGLFAPDSNCIVLSLDNRPD